MVRPGRGVPERLGPEILDGGNPGTDPFGAKPLASAEWKIRDHRYRRGGGVAGGAAGLRAAAARGWIPDRESAGGFPVRRSERACGLASKSAPALARKS